MILQEQYALTAKTNCQRPATEPLLIGCPVCGRPTKIRQHLVGEELACAHCHGTFVVTEQMDGSKTARSTTAARKPNEPTVSLRSMPMLPSREQNALPQPKQRGQSKARPVAFVVESRDEVYARLAGDLIEGGYRVVRALTVTDALKACGKYQPQLIVAKIDVSSVTWQMAPKMVLLDSGTRVWLYDHAIEVHDYAMADFLGIEHLIEYEGDLLRLSTRIRQLLGNRSSGQTETMHGSVA